MRKTLEIGTHSFPIVWVFFSHSIHRKKLKNLIMWEMHGFSHQFLIARENATQPIVCGEPGKLVLILSPWYGCFFPSDFHPMVCFSIC